MHIELTTVQNRHMQICSESSQAASDSTPGGWDWYCDTVQWELKMVLHVALCPKYDILSRAISSIDNNSFLLDQ